MPDQRTSRTVIPGLTLVDLEVERGDDGWATQAWDREGFAALGLPRFSPARQDVRHLARRGDTFGFSADTRARLVQAVGGRAFVAWVDLRDGAGRGGTTTRELVPGRAAYVPAGVAQAVQVLEPGTTLVTLIDEKPVPGVVAEGMAFDAFDPTLAIVWPLGGPASETRGEVARPTPSGPHRGPRRAAPEPEPHDEAFRVLFVCTANICRSAYADVAACAAAPDGFEFSSAGTRALVGHVIDPPMAEQLHGRGEPGRHRARQLTRAMIDDADLILTMAGEHRRFILDEWPALGRKTFVLGHAARVLARVAPGTPRDHVLEHLWANRTAEEGDDVRDPYKQGPEAAEFAASTIDSYLEVLINALSPPAR